MLSGTLAFNFLFVHLMNVSPIFTLLLARICSPPTPDAECLCLLLLAVPHSSPADHQMCNNIEPSDVTVFILSFWKTHKHNNIELSRPAQTTTLPFVCLLILVCLSAELCKNWISTKLGGRTGHGPRRNPLNCVPDKGEDPGMC